VANHGNLAIDAGLFREIVAGFQELLAKNEQLLNDLNVFPVPDSDTGSNSLQTLKTGIASSAGDSTDLGHYAQDLAAGAAKSAMGNSGVILAQYLHGLAQVFSQTATPNQCSPYEWQQALQQAADIARQAVLTPAEGTMLTVADAAAKVQAHSDFKTYYEEIQIAVRAAVIDTQNLLPELTAAEVIDAGALVLSYFHDSVATILGLSIDPFVVKPRNASELKYSGPAFELMFSVVCPQSVKTEIETKISSLGDSIAISGTEPNFNFHIHTDQPQLVIETCEAISEITNIRISELGN
jgi:dihydroxyacetone kinase-like predicted kinase